MKAITFRLRISGKEFAVPLTPRDVRSYGRKPVAYCAPEEETIHVVADEGVATIYVATAGQRESLAKQLKSGGRPEVRVEDPEVIGIRLVIYESGWPHKRYRSILCHRVNAEDGVLSYSTTFTPNLGRLTFLAPGNHPYREIASILNPAVEKTTVAHELIFLSLRDGGVWQSIVIISDSPGSANLVELEIHVQAAEPIEMNDVVRAIILSRAAGCRIYGFDNLSKTRQEALMANGARLIARPVFTGEHSADSYEGYPFYQLNIPIEDVPGFALPAQEEAQP